MTIAPPASSEAAPARAVVLICAVTLLFASMDAGAKFLVISGMDARFVSWTRFAVHLVMVLILFRGWDNRAMFRAASLPLQFVRGMFLFGSTIFNFWALQTLQLAQTMSIYFFAPMVITALAGPLLGEWAGWRRWTAVAVGFAGVLVITRPGFTAFEIGHVLALCSMLSYCFYVMMTRSMGASESPESLILYSALTPVIFMAPTLPFAASLPPDALHGIVLIALGLLGGFGHWLLIKAYRLASTTALAPYPYLQMIWMIAYGWLIFGQLPDGWTLAGAAIIVASGIYIVHREHRLRLKNRSLPNAEDEELAKKL